MENQPLSPNATTTTKPSPGTCNILDSTNSSKKRGLRYAFLSLPSFGHMNPTLELIKELIANGSSVQYFSVSKFRSRIEEAGAQFVDYESNICNMLASKSPPDETSSNINLVIQLFEAVNQEIWPTLPQKLADIDVIVYDNFSIWGKDYAVQYNIPSFCSNTMMLITREDYMESLNFQETTDKQRDFLDCLTGSKANGVILYTFPELQKSQIPEDLQHRYVHFSNRITKLHKPSTAEFNPKSLIYIAIGTVWRDKKDILKTFATILSSTEHEVIISTGAIDELYEQLIALELGKNIRIEKFVNQLEILGRASLFVTHAGMNSVYEGLSLGVPMIMIPQMKEQYINACKIKELGAGYLLPLEELSEAEVRVSMLDMEANWKNYKQGALIIREKMMRYPDAEACVKKMNEILEKC